MGSFGLSVSKNCYLNYIPRINLLESVFFLQTTFPSNKRTPELKWLKEISDMHHKKKTCIPLANLVPFSDSYASLGLQCICYIIKNIELSLTVDRQSARFAISGIQPKEYCREDKNIFSDLHENSNLEIF